MTSPNGVGRRFPLSGSSPAQILRPLAFNPQQETEEPDPFEGLDLNPGITQRIADGMGTAPDLSPKEAWRRSNHNRRKMLSALWDEQVQKHARAEAEAFDIDAAPAELRDRYNRGVEEINRAMGAKPDGSAVATKSAGLGSVRDQRPRLASPPPWPEDPRFAPYFAHQKELFERKARAEAAVDPEKAATAKAGMAFVPLLGNFLSAKEAIETWPKAFRELERGNVNGFLINSGLAAIDTIGAFAIGGSGVTRLGKEAFVRMIDATPGARQLVAGKQLKRQQKAFDDKAQKIPNKGADVIGDPFTRLSKSEQKALQNHLNRAFGTAGEHRVADLFRKFGQDVATGKGAARITGTIGGKPFTRTHDVLVTEFRDNFANRILGIVDPRTQRLAVEVKTGKKGLEKPQRETDTALRENTAEINKRTRPDEIQNLRVPLHTIPEKTVIKEMRSALRGKVSPALERDLIKGFKAVRRQDEEWLTLDVWIGVMARAAALELKPDKR